MPCFQLSMGVWASNCVLIHLRTYGLRTDGLLEETNAHASKTRSSPVTVSACTVLDCQNWSICRGTAQVPTNQVRYVRIFFATKIWIYRGMEDANQSKWEQYMCTRVRTCLAPNLNSLLWNARCLYLLVKGYQDIMQHLRPPRDQLTSNWWKVKSTG